VCGVAAMVVGGHPPTESDLLDLEFGPNPYDPRSEDEAREFLGWACLTEVGKGDPRPYCTAVGLPEGFSGHWCGIFILARAHFCGLTDWPWVIDPVHKHWGFCYRLPMVTRAQAKPSDVAYYTKHQHHALWVGDGRIVNGNGVGGRVSVSRVEDGASPDAFYSIEPWVERFSHVQP